MPREWDHGWNTESEVAFLKGLGTFNLARGTGPRTRREWLKAYEKAMALRNDWSKIDRETIRASLRFEMELA